MSFVRSAHSLCLLEAAVVVKKLNSKAIFTSLSSGRMISTRNDTTDPSEPLRNPALNTNLP